MKTNIRIPAVPIFTHEGAKADHITPLQQLRRSVMTNMLFEDNAYENGRSIADRILDAILDHLKGSTDNPKKINDLLDLAYSARTQMKLRHVPLLILSTLAKMRLPVVNAHLAAAITATIQRPDELGEFISLFWADGKKMLPAQVKKGLAGAFAKFNEYSLAKYNSDSAAIKLRDVLFLVHAKPVDAAQADLWKRLVDGQLTTPDTWEVELSAGKDKGETFTRLIKEKKLGALALLRNLRNMLAARVDEEVIKSALREVPLDRVLPFRFITAARYAPKLEPELESAMLKCLTGHPKLPGKTVLVVDNSGSMGHQVSAKSELTRKDAAAALSMLLREVCENIQVVVFGRTAGLVRPRRGFALRDEIVNCPHNGSTDLRAGIVEALAEGYDRIIIITDEQSQTPLIGPGLGKRGYIINVANMQNGVGYREYVHVDGWSEAIVDYIQAFEASE